MHTKQALNLFVNSYEFYINLMVDSSIHYMKIGKDVMDNDFYHFLFKMCL
jgi:hypothetical protein